MRMILLLAACLAVVGCQTETRPVPVPTVVVESVPSKPAKLDKKLTRDCRVYEVSDVPNAESMPAGDVAIELAKLRKEALEECNRRMRKIRRGA